MDSLANYGSDDEYEETNSEKTGISGPAESLHRTTAADANYDEVQMDLSEESNNNNSAEDEDQPKIEKPADRKRSHRSRSREDPRSSRSTRHRKDRSEDRNTHRKDEDRDRSRKYESKSKESSSDDRHDRKSARDERNVKSRDEKRRYRRSSSKDRRRSSSKDRRRSSSRDRKRFGSPEKSRRSSSKERRRSRSPRKNDHRRRSNSKDRDNRASNSRYGKRFDRTSNKIAQLEKLGIEIKTPDSEFITPQMLLQRSMDEQVQKVKNSTGIELPKYYNPAAMNPTRYADQIQKRRLLWQKKDAPEEAKPMGKVWEQTTFAQDSDGKVASKFKRLMGIKDNSAASTREGGKDILKKQEEMFSSMEQQYEVARTATHTMRGVGLGFGTFNNYPR